MWYTIPTTIHASATLSIADAHDVEHNGEFIFPKRKVVLQIERDGLPSPSLL
jgi:hypothetical protein